MGATATFDYGLWTARYPEFAQCPLDVATLYWAEACIYHKNDGTGPVTDAGMQAALLNMLTAHIAALNFGVNGEPPTPLVGRINSANEGSVSVGTDMPAMPTASAYYQQTKYGLAYWNAMAPFRTMHYRAPRQRIYDPMIPPGDTNYPYS